MTEFMITKKNAEMFKKLLEPVMIDPTIESWKLAIALDWAREKQINFYWFKEDAAGLVNNGLSLVDQNGKLLWNDITGFEDEEDKLLQEAMNAHLVMHQMDTEWIEYD